MQNQEMYGLFPERMRPSLTFVLKRDDGIYWKLHGPTPRSPEEAVLFSATYERLDAEYLITSNANYMHSSLKFSIFSGLLVRIYPALMLTLFILTFIYDKGICESISFFFLFIIGSPLFELANIVVFIKYRFNFEPRICFSRKDNAVFVIDSKGNIHKMPWKDTILYIDLYAHYGLGGSSGYTYMIKCSVLNQDSKKFYKFLTPVYEIKSFFHEDSIQRLEGIYNFIHYYMEHGLEGLNTAYAGDDLIEEGKLPCGVTLMRPSPPFKPDKEFANTSDLIKDIVWRFIFFPFWPPLLLNMRPRLRKFPFEETES